ncbi:hypothetical protein ADK51_15130, partial [Streptomyces sp. WM6368]
MTGGDDRTVRRWDLDTGQQCGRPLTGHDGEVVAVATALLEGDAVAVTGDGEGVLRIWNLHTGTQAAEPWAGHEGPVRAV